MGYYTNFEIKVTGTEDFDTIHSTIEQVSDYSFDENPRTKSMSSCDTYKWYGWQDNMKEVSRKFPNSLFIVDGIGEEEGDIWRCYFRRGKMDYIEAEIGFRDSHLKAEHDAEIAIDKMLTGDECETS